MNWSHEQLAPERGRPGHSRSLLDNPCCDRQMDEGPDRPTQIQRVALLWLLLDRPLSGAYQARMELATIEHEPTQGTRITYHHGTPPFCPLHRRTVLT